jgi:hypothetical protein
MVSVEPYPLLYIVNNMFIFPMFPLKGFMKRRHVVALILALERRIVKRKIFVVRV